jgi:predicted metal-dependent HD superfamily phosphohydrolase
MWRRLRAQGDGLDAYARLRTAYEGADRAYHNLVHIDECLRELEGARHLTADAAALEAAIWFHDVVYDSHATDNEEKSAALWRDVAAAARVEPRVVEKAADLILATKHAAVPTDADARLVVDVDLAILGQPPERFDEYERQIRAEYAWVGEEQFAAGRGKVLRTFLARPLIYSTEHFRARYEAPARSNLAMSVRRLGQPST